MELKKILALKVIANYENFSKAAVHLSVSQSLLSKYITDLETEFGVRLLYRNGRGAQLTPEGVRLLDYTQRIEDLIATAASDLRGMKEVPSGNVSVGLSSAVGATLTIPLLTAVRRLHPAIHMQIAEGISGYVNEWLNTGRLDLAVVFDKSAGPSNHENLVREELLVVSPSGQRPGDAADCAGIALRELPFVLPGRSNKLRGVIDAYTHELGFLLKPVAEIDSLAAMIGAVEAGLGHTILPFGAVRAALKDGRVAVTRLAAPGLRRTIYLAASTERVPTRAVQVVADLIKRVSTELGEQGFWSPSDEMLAAPSGKR
ncbi:MAG: LysR family transcriptional regulator [Burkholderiales bacterium]|nr:LysR family transcriptional regulator [Burkholderiales bacterium]ODU62352.1 MAG: hypothetical protein ABT05_07710 [Lautropia sp. SCN 66-9]